MIDGEEVAKLIDARERRIDELRAELKSLEEERHALGVVLDICFQPNSDDQRADDADDHPAGQADVQPPRRSRRAKKFDLAQTYTPAAAQAARRKLRSAVAAGRVTAKSAEKYAGHITRRTVEAAS